MCCKVDTQSRPEVPDRPLMSWWAYIPLLKGGPLGFTGTVPIALAAAREKQARPVGTADGMLALNQMLKDPEAYQLLQEMMGVTAVGYLSKVATCPHCHNRSD